MSKKLEGNGLWESSRMMLPEHKEAYLLHQQHLQKKERPHLDEQEMERIALLMAESLAFKTPVTVLVFDERHTRAVTGIVIRMDPQRRAIRLAAAEGCEWIGIGDVIDAGFTEG